MPGRWFAEQAVLGAIGLADAGADGGGGVACFAHVGGCVFGLAYFAGRD